MKSPLPIPAADDCGSVSLLNNRTPTIQHWLFGNLNVNNNSSCPATRLTAEPLVDTAWKSFAGEAPGAYTFESLVHKPPFTEVIASTTLSIAVGSNIPTWLPLAIKKLVAVKFGLPYIS
ncbi:hypothetical protein D3C87_1023150 [compost metagenome]